MLILHVVCSADDGGAAEKARGKLQQHPRRTYLHDCLLVECLSLSFAAVYLGPSSNFSVNHCLFTRDSPQLSGLAGHFMPSYATNLRLGLVNPSVIILVGCTAIIRSHLEFGCGLCLDMGGGGICACPHSPLTISRVSCGDISRN